MPSQDSSLDSERDRDKDKDRDKDRDLDITEKSDRVERGSAKQKPSSSQKTKDLSHVPCKFFKVGACTAGSSCPFSHAVPEPGHKEVCAWFVKGNCKFGHKCALAHILPGQSMAMDRKNKKLAQAAAAVTAAAEKGTSGSKEGSKDVAGKGGAVRKRDGPHGVSVVAHGGVNSTNATHGGSGRNTALFTGGSTAPTRILRSSSASTSSTRPPINMPLKATISPSVPAPPLKDTDFASFAALDEMEGVEMPARPGQEGMDDDFIGDNLETPMPDTVLSGGKVLYSLAIDQGLEKSDSSSPSPVHLPTSAPRPSAPLTTTNFGPIGSPPAARLNGTLPNRKVVGTLSPGTSPRPSVGATLLQQKVNHDISLSPPAGQNTQSYLAPSPFSAPGTQSIFLSNSLNTPDPSAGPNTTTGRDNGSPRAFSMGGVAASLGTGMALLSGNGGDIDDIGTGILKGNRAGRSSGMKTLAAEQAIGDEDLEDFIPSSLSDLLTPEERRRRMSRSGQHQPQVHGAPIQASRLPNAGDSLPSSGAMGHRYSHSVPAPSLLGDLKSIWANTAVVNQQRGATPMVSEADDATGLHVSPGKALPNGGRNLLTDDMGLSMSMGSPSSVTVNAGLSPSNASAAFLPGLHHYLKAKQAGLPAGSGLVSNAGRNGTNTGAGASLTRGIRTASGPVFPGATTSNNPAMGNVGGRMHGGNTHPYRTTPSPFDLAQPQPHHNPGNRPLGNFGGTGDDSLNNPYILSPSARALQAHEPGQSLPQGLAAGLSRIHALPPLHGLSSPGTSLSSNTISNGLLPTGPYEEWKTSPSPGPNMFGGAHMLAPMASGAANSGSDPHFPRTYSAVTRASTGSNNSSPPVLARTVASVGRYQHAPGTVATRSADDDDLFAMDG